MIEAEAVERARRLGRLRGLILDPADLRDVIPNALTLLGEEVGDGSEYALQQKEAALTLTSGVASLSSVSDILIDTIETVKHPNIDGGGNAAYFSHLPGSRKDLSTYTKSLNDDYPYVVEKNAICCSLGNGTWPASDDLPPDTAALEVLYSESPSITTLNANFNERLVELMVMLAGKAQEGIV